MKLNYASLIKSLFVIILLSLSTGLMAASGPEQMERFLKDLNSLEARFEQSVTIPDQTVIRSRGVFYLKRPRMFRWDYSQPERQQIVADGRQIWLYDPELEQVSVQSETKALRGTPAMLLTSGEPVEKAFEVLDLGQSQEMAWVELTPRDEESQFTRIQLGFADNELRQMEMADKFGQLTQFQFFDIRQNPQLDDWFFRFERPENVDIYNQ